MGDLKISRRRFVTAGAIGTLGVLVAPETVLAQDDQGGRLRWDLVAVGGGVVVPGGTDTGRDAASGDTAKLTGSGFANLDEGTARGGGTFLHQHADGSVVAQGVYFVTGFRSFVNGGGSLVGTGLTDEVGRLDQTTGGILTLNIRAAGTSVNGVLEVHCSLPGSTPTQEGIRLHILTFNFVQAGGATIFHRLED